MGEWSKSIGEKGEDIVKFIFENILNFNSLIENDSINCIRGYFGLQGSGGGMNSTDSLFYHSKKLKEKGYNVNIIPKVIENKLIHDFEYFDNNLTINDLYLKSIHLFNYSKGKHSSIKDEFNRLNQKYFA